MWGFCPDYKVDVNWQCKENTAELDASTFGKDTDRYSSATLNTSKIYTISVVNEVIWT